MKTRRTGKGAIAFLLALCITIACMSAPAFAAPDAGQDQLQKEVVITAASGQAVAAESGATGEKAGTSMGFQAAESGTTDDNAGTSMDLQAAESGATGETTGTPLSPQAAEIVAVSD